MSRPLVVIPAARKGRFVESVVFGDWALTLNGSGLCEWGILGIDLYRAALYVERRPRSREELLNAEQVVVVHLQFCRELTTKQLHKAYEAAVRANAGSDFARCRAPLGSLLALLESVRAEETYTFLAIPGEGLVVQRGHKVMGRIADEEFSRLFLRLYLGDLPPTQALRRGLLGGLA